MGFFDREQTKYSRDKIMIKKSETKGNGLMLLVSWIVVGVPLVWGVYNTLLKLPALFR